MHALRKIIREVIEQMDDFLLVIKAGHELFHGTIEKFDKKDAHPGGYDKIFWTTEESLISQTYIPNRPNLHTNTNSISNPSKNDYIRNIQKTIGLDYDYSQIEFDGQRAKSYMTPSVFEGLWDRHSEALRKLMELEKEMERLHDEYSQLRYDKKEERQAIINQIKAIKARIPEAQKEYSDSDVDKIKNEFVNQQLQKLGYEPSNESNYNGNHSWQLKLSNGVIQPADYNPMGRLFIVTPKRDLKIYDATMGGKRVPDLMDVDYHRHDWFQRAMSQGYDGIRITDYAQSIDQGNFGHLSIGLFQNTLKDVDIEEIDAQHHPLEKAYQAHDYRSPEYMKHRNLNK